MITIRKRPLEFTDYIAKLYPELVNREDSENRSLSKVVTFQVTDACNLACTYCYQINKGKRVMSFEVAKKFIDLLLSGDKGFSDYVGVEKTPGIVLDFIGGEPLLQADLIDKIIDYFRTRALELDHPWAERYMCSISSNGVLYFEPNVQKFLEKHRKHLSFSVSIDGNKELHDSCRVFPDGKPSYDIAVAGAMDWMSRGHYMGSKITVAPANVGYVYEASRHMIELGYYDININCVYEDGWKLEHATTLYQQLKKFADYLLSLDNTTDYYYAFFKEDCYEPMEESDNQNWCWGAGTPILTTNGYKPIEQIRIGDLVYTEDGSIHPVINTTSHFADNVVRISFNEQYNLICTDDHKLYTKPYDYTDNEIIYYQDYGTYMVKDLDNNALIKLFHLPEECDESFIKEFIIENSEGIWLKGLTKTKESPQMVYNITVDTNHSYVAGGIVSANCGGNGVMLSCDPDGVLYPCIRYMESSLGTDQPPIIIGNVDDGIAPTQEIKDCISCLQCITRRSQSTDECFYCPIGKGCSWCSAFNYQTFGTVDKRATFICDMHKAASLANVYYWNKLYEKYNMNKKLEMHCPKDWAIPIIGEEEYNMLYELQK